MGFPWTRLSSSLRLVGSESTLLGSTLTSCQPAEGSEVIESQYGLLSVHYHNIRYLAELRSKSPHSGRTAVSHQEAAPSVSRSDWSVQRYPHRPVGIQSMGAANVNESINFLTETASIPETAAG